MLKISQFISAATPAMVALSLCGAASASDGVAVRVANNGTEDVVVTIYDNSASPSRTVLQQERINGFTAVPIQVLADREGKANLSWTAIAVEGTSRKCGEARNVEVSDSDQLTVSATSNCSNE